MLEISRSCLQATFPHLTDLLCKPAPDSLGKVHNTRLNTTQIQLDAYVTGGPLASGGLLVNQGNLHLINTELKSIVILIKDTGLDSPLYSSAPGSGLGFNFIWFSVCGSTSIWIACPDACLAFISESCNVNSSTITPCIHRNLSMALTPTWPILLL